MEVGMSQTGADSMAKTGANYEEIIKHFYTDGKKLNNNFLKMNNLLKKVNTSNNKILRRNL